MRYFQDDDSVGLHEMVRREKMSSAEDQNSLYARMAGKVRCIRYKQPVLSVKCKCAHPIHQSGNLEHHRVLDLLFLCVFVLICIYLSSFRVHTAELLAE